MRYIIDSFMKKLSKYPKGSIVYLNDQGKLHCEDGPAVVQPDGKKEWYINGRRHRLDGPAIIWADGREDWFQNSRRHRIGGPSTTFPGGTKFWSYKGKYHRTDGPAIEEHNGNKTWYHMGLIHRLDGPAIEHSNGTKGWYINGLRHCITGPAIEWYDGRKEWFYQGVQLSQHHPVLRDECKWEMIKGNPENIQAIREPSFEMQEYVLQIRPDLINLIEPLNPSLKVKYQHELNLAGVEI